MTRTAYFSILGAIYLAPTLQETMPTFVFGVGCVCMIIALCLHLYFGKDCDMSDPLDWD